MSTSSESQFNSSPPQSSASVLGSLSSELDRLAPRFDVEASQIRILQSPSQFYETLKTKILNAQRRIYISTLYIGKTEHDLTHPNLKVSFLTDALRGTRETPEPSCASLLAPLVADFGPERVEVRMYHTPNLTGLRKKIIPRRINEGWGLQHMKLYGVDDDIIMSGANLSTDYFTNRQDRYHVFSSKEITDYFARIHYAVASISYLVRPDPDDPAGYLLQWPDSNQAPNPLDAPGEYVKKAGALLNPLIQPLVATKGQTQPATDTVVYPLAQFTPLLSPDTSTEHPSLTTVLRHLSTPAFANSRWAFTAGYFNISPEFKQLLMASKPKNGTIIAASPWANGFYGSKGVSGMLPPAYTLLARRFLESIQRAGLGEQIELKEWRKGTVGEPDGWTYHAKGIWVTLPEEQTPSITVVGSSNYTKRSYSLDLEVNTLIVTRNEDLKKRLGAEQAWLQEYAKTVDIDEFTKPERRVSIVVRISMLIVTLLGGAL
ncbi:MAG: hypothetical protein M1819_007158 [Sarea resinae]|nr:MAG: hypothetical protein M1819_007158 [Sarea resinae]